MFAADGGYDSGAASHAVLLELRRAMTRHPGVVEARGHPPGQFTRIRADVDPGVFGGAASSGVVTVRWFAGEHRESRPEFAFHYRDEGGFDCGWHHEANPHVDGWAHYQERDGTDDEYTYASVSFESTEPVRVLWAVFDRLEKTLQARES